MNALLYFGFCTMFYSGHDVCTNDIRVDSLTPASIGIIRDKLEDLLGTQINESSLVYFDTSFKPFFDYCSKGYNYHISVNKEDARFIDSGEHIDPILFNIRGFDTCYWKKLQEIEEHNKTVYRLRDSIFFLKFGDRTLNSLTQEEFSFYEDSIILNTEEKLLQTYIIVDIFKKGHKIYFSYVKNLFAEEKYFDVSKLMVNRRKFEIGQIELDMSDLDSSHIIYCHCD